VFGLIVIQLFRLQVLNHKLYATKANQQQIMKSTIFAKRGEIYFLDGDTPVPIVMNKKTYTISIDPSLVVKKREEITKKIDEIVGAYRVKTGWDEVFADPERKYFVVAKNVPYHETNNLKKADLTGVYEQETTTRVYPEGEMAAQVLGFVNQEGEGQYGVEGSLNKELTGENGLLKTVKDSNNVPLTIGNENVKIPAKDGKNLVLTIDRNIQKKAEEAVDEVTKRFNITYGSAIVMNPATGQILAMAGKPGYNPAEYAKVTDAKVFQTDVTMNAFNPASVCKTFAIAAAIDSGVMTPETTYYNTDRLMIDGWPIENAINGHTGEISMQTVLTYSLNTGSIQALKLLGGSASEITYQGKEKLYDYYHNKLKLNQRFKEYSEADGTFVKISVEVDGFFVEKIPPRSFTQNIIVYYNNRILKEEGEFFFCSDVKIGKWRKYDKEGKLIREENEDKKFEELRITGNEAYRIGTRNVFINDVLQDDNNHTIDVYLSKISQANGGVKLYEKYHKADGAEEGYQRYEFKNENFTDDNTGEKYTQTIHVDIKNDIHVDL